MEEGSYDCNDRIFWDGWKSINYLETMDLARHACGELGVRCSPWTTHGCWMSASIRFEPVETEPGPLQLLRCVTCLRAQTHQARITCLQHGCNQARDFSDWKSAKLVIDRVVMVVPIYIRVFCQIVKHVLVVNIVHRD